MSAKAGELPFEDSQFEVVVLNGCHLGAAVVREAHRVLLPGGHLHFSVLAKVRGQEGQTLPEIYSCVREGFDIVSLVRPRGWWPFGSKPRMFTVCARRKNWRSHRQLKVWA